MIKNSLIFIAFIIFNDSFAAKAIDPLRVLCAKKFFESELTQESKKFFNECITFKEFPNDTFDFSNQTIQDYDASELYLKGFNFTNSKLIDFNFRNARLEETRFDYTVFEGVDFYDTDFKGVHFTNCKFIRCNLENTDLSQTNLKGCKFKKVKLNGACLYDGVRFDGRRHIEWVKLYAEFIRNGEKEKAKGLNKVFGALKLKLVEADLKDMDLTGIDLHRADLKEASLQNVILSETLVLPDYEEHEELVLLYDRFIKEGKKEDIKTLNMIFGGLNLFLGGASLDNLDLKGINLSYAWLNGANLTNTNLTDANLKYTDLSTYSLNGLKISENLTLQFDELYDLSELFDRWNEWGPDQPLYQKLVNAQVPMFENVPYEQLKEKDWKGLNLKNANFHEMELKGFDFSNANLKRADLDMTNLTDGILINTNLKKAKIISGSLFCTNLSGANLRGTDLTYVNLEHANLLGAKLKAKDLNKEKWLNAILSRELCFTQKYFEYDLGGVIEVLQSQGVIIEQKEIKDNEPPLKKVKLRSNN